MVEPYGEGFGELPVARPDFLGGVPGQAIVLEECVGLGVDCCAIGLLVEESCLEEQGLEEQFLKLLCGQHLCTGCPLGEGLGLVVATRKSKEYEHCQCPGQVEPERGVGVVWFGHVVVICVCTDYCGSFPGCW